MKVLGRSGLVGLAMALLLGDLPAEGSSGLTMQAGRFYRNGQPVQAIGINYFSAFLRKLGPEGTEPNLEDCSYRAGFETLARYEIPFIRFCAGSF